MGKHFELTDNYIITPSGVKLYQIRCTRDFQYAEAGDLGGYIENENNLSDNAWVCGDAQVSDNAWVCGDANIKDHSDHCGFDCFGSEGRHTHAYRTKHNGIEVTCGCFRGSVEEFERQVLETHGNNQYAAEYLAIIQVIKVKFGI